ncbi:MAG TPA: hypothetical protein VIF57_32965, partial [Polyangia bacterium]
MPRRRSDGLTDLTFGTTAVGAAAALVAVAALAGCQAGTADTGCQIGRQIVLPGTTPLPLWPEVRIDRLDGGFVILGSDTTAVRWTAIDMAGTVATEQVVALPPGALRAYYALAGAGAPGDTVVVGVLGTAANGTDAELSFLAAPLDGSAAGAPSAPVVIFPGGADPLNAPPMVAMGTSASAMYAGAAWIDPQSGFPTYAFVDGLGQVIGEPAVIENEPAPGYSCLGFSPGKQELTISYQKAPVDPLLGPQWLIADVPLGGGVSTLRLNVTQPNGTMSCARGTVYQPAISGASLEYAIAWQDPSGRWLSVYEGPSTGQVKSYPFASSTDFGGPDLQPPLVGLTAFGSDFGVLAVRPHSVEMWRLDRVGNRRSGSLVFPSLEGDISGVSS